MATNTTWRGTSEESYALINAIAHHCTCRFGLTGIRLHVCSAHRLLTDNQRALDGLLFSRRMVRRLLEEEFLAGQRPSAE
jgi:hypothetical protein